MYDTRLCKKKCCGIYGTTPTHNDIKMNTKNVKNTRIKQLNIQQTKFKWFGKIFMSMDLQIQYRGNYNTPLASYKSITLLTCVLPDLFCVQSKGSSSLTCKIILNITYIHKTMQKPNMIQLGFLTQAKIQHG